MSLKLSQKSLDFLKTEVAGAMPDYELRTPQLDMMEACSNAIEEGGTLMAEAGTGTGKTFAYLIPIILSGKHAIVSTGTISLQGQLASKDMGFLSQLVPFSYTVAKGRRNYLCLRRLDAFRAENDKEADEYTDLVNWSSQSETGDTEDYNLKKSLIWKDVYSDSDACRGRKCAYYGQCFYFKARQKWGRSQIVVANHAIVSINAMLSEGSKILPRTDILIIDEGHALDNALSEQIGITISKRGFEIILNKLLKPDERGNYKGLLSNSRHLFQIVESMRTETELFWMQVKNQLKNRETINGDFSLSDTMLGLSASVESLIHDIKTSITGLFKEDQEIEMESSLIKLKGFADAVGKFSKGMDGFVRWPEIEENKISLRMSPVYPRDFVIENILPNYRSIILTSATLSVAGNFGLMENTLGFNEAERLALVSPFDLKNQVTIEIKNGIDLQKEEGIEALAKVVTEEASKKDGGVLVLFTSKEVMGKIWDLTSDTLTKLGLNPMVQGELPNKVMLEVMRETENSVIFGLNSFWEGVDIKGDSLKCLIITKLPFEVPSEPIVKARTEEIERNGGNAFYEYSLPKAVLRFKQGFGRLIRSRDDIGRVIICDERIKTKAYGKRFLKSVIEVR